MLVFYRVNKEGTAEREEADTGALAKAKTLEDVEEVVSVKEKAAVEVEDEDTAEKLGMPEDFPETYVSEMPVLRGDVNNV